jgi:hypothetical protein
MSLFFALLFDYDHPPDGNGSRSASFLSLLNALAPKRRGFWTRKKPYGRSSRRILIFSSRIP